MPDPKIQYTIQLDEDEFLREFQDSWTDAQLDLMTSGFKGMRTNQPELLDPDSIDPKSDPVAARDILMNPQSTFRIFEQPVIIPLIPYLNAAKQKIPPEIQLLKEQYNIYLVSYSVDAKPQGKEKFTEVELHLAYPEKQGFLTHSMAPDTELEERYRVYAKTKVGLDSHLKFKLPDVELQPGISVGGGIDTAVEAGFIFSFDYRPLSAEIIALGVQSSYAEWVIKKPQQMIGSVQFSTVIFTPKDAKKLPILAKGFYKLERGIWWWKRETEVKIKSKEPIIAQLP